MALNSKFDMSSSSPDGPTYSNGQRGQYSAASLEKLGSFRESSDRILTLPPGTSKYNATPSLGDMTCLLQPLASDLKVVAADLRSNRPGDMRRAISSIFGASADDTPSVMFGSKPLPSSSLEEIKRLKNSLQDNFTKARDRAKIFGDASLKIDKFCHNITRKRSRIDSSLGERPTGLCQGSISKTGPQNHLSGCALEIGSQRLEEKSKISAPNKRIRTSPVDMDIHANGISKTSGFIERDKDISKATNGNAAHADENDRAFSTIVDGWERSRMKKKRSVIKSDLSACSGPVKFQGDRETKRGAPHNIGIDSRPKLNYSQNFRPGLNNNTALVGKSDLCVQPNASSMRSRNEPSNASISNDKREARFCLDAESPSIRAITKPNGREDCRAASPTLSKIGSARGPRSNPGSLLKTSPIIHRVAGNAEDMEPPQTLNGINKKRSASVRSSSPPVGQWAVPRPKKIPRSSRRSSLSPLTSTHDDLSISETMEDAPINHDDFGGTKRSLSSNASQHNKIRDNFVSSLLSESEESDLRENKLREKVKKCPEIEGKLGQTIQKFTNLIMPTRKNRMAVEEDCGDFDRRQGRVGRGFTPSRSSMTTSIEKLGDVVTTKQQRSIRHGSERVESKPGRPPIKKLSERKNYTRPRQLVNNLSLDFSDEAADDHEELVAAASAALETGWRCSGSFWKQVEPLFSLVSTDAAVFLRKQILITTESTARANDAGGDLQSFKIDEENALLSSATVVSIRCESNSFSRETADSDPLLEECMPQSGSYSGISICQALLSAIIGEDDMDDIYSTIDYGVDCSYNDSYAGHYTLDKSLKTKGLNVHLQEDNQTSERTLDYYKVDSNWIFRDEKSQERSKPNMILETVNRPLPSLHQDLSQLAPNPMTTISSACTELQYNQMSINDRILLELSEIGLYPEHVPGLYGEDEDITKNICALEQKLQEQTTNRINLLLKLEKIVVDVKELQQRKFERLAMDHLVKIAYDKYMSCWGPGASGSKNMSKFAKHAAQAFIKRALARCKKYEETSIGCFSEPFYRDIFLSASSSSSDLRVPGIPADSSQINARVNSNGKRSNSQSMEHPSCKEEALPNRIKKKEVFLDDVFGSASGALSTAPNLGNSLVSSAKGKRSERDRDGKVHNRDSVFKNGTAKIGRPVAPVCKGERKNKAKPKIKTSQLPASANALHNKATTPSPFPDRDAKKDTSLLPDVRKNKLSNESDRMDLSSLQLPDMDVVDFGGQGQDIASWLNFDDDGLQDHDDFMGLEIPMDDLSEVHMMI